VTRYGTIPAKPPYWALEGLVAHLSLRVAELEAAAEMAWRDPGEYRRGYLAGYHADHRKAPQNLAFCCSLWSWAVVPHVTLLGPSAHRRVLCCMREANHDHAS
jgi:hypothetical protein